MHVYPGYNGTAYSSVATPHFRLPIWYIMQMHVLSHWQYILSVGAVMIIPLISNLMSTSMELKNLGPSSKLSMINHPYPILIQIRFYCNDLVIANCELLYKSTCTLTGLLAVINSYAWVPYTLARLAIWISAAVINIFSKWLQNFVSFGNPCRLFTKSVTFCGSTVATGVDRIQRWIHTCTVFTSGFAQERANT